MTLVIEAFELDKKTNIVYLEKMELQVPTEGYIQY